MISRRSLLRAAALVGSAALLPGTRPRAAPAFATSNPYQCGIFTSADAVTRSAMAVEPFTQALRLPSVLAPTDADDTADYYDITMQPAELEVVAGTTTTLWTYNGEFPGPTLEVTRGREARVLQHNQLEVPVTVHLHGGHISSEADGHPDDLIPPGGSKEYRYVNSQLAATLWYHDHRHHHTADSVYRGLAGLYLIRDPEEDAAFSLPSGDRDVPLVLMDRSFAEDGSLIHPPHDGSSFGGDTVLVNGVPHPYVEVDAARYRFRVLNASNSRAYRLALSNGASFTRIGSDGGLLAAPVEAPTVLIHPAERVELVVDFTGLVGQSVLLKDEFGQWEGLVRFDVTAQAPDDSVIPDAMRTIAPLGAPSVTREVVASFDTRSGLWVLDGKPYDGERVDQYPKLGATEVWRFTNVSEVEHPMHPHLVMFQVLKRNDDPPGPGYEGWKDTVVVPPGESIDVAMRFEDFVGRFVYHCHNLEHEDHDMMAQFKVVDLPRLAGDSRLETAVAIADARFTAPLPVAYVATARDFPDALAAGPAVAAAGGALLLTEPDALPDVTAAALDRLGPGRIVVLGGPRAVGDGVIAALRDHTDGEVTRVEGADRYATAAAISRTYVEAGAPVYVASGRGFADALVGGAAAAARGAALLLTDPDELPPATAAELDRISPSQIVLLGGTAAVSRAVEQRLAAYGPVDRRAGGDRYATAAGVVADAFPLPVEEVFVATGRAFPDALAGTPAAAGAPLLLVEPGTVPDVIGQQLARLKPNRIVVLGGPGAVSVAVEDELATYLPD